MPIYQYVCKACGYDFERVQPFSADPLRTCPQCQGAVRRVISSVGIIFKGSGWYITDSKRQLAAGRTKSARQLTDGRDGGGTTEAAAPDGAAVQADTKDRGKPTGGKAEPAAPEARTGGKETKAPPAPE